jgi:hypothetical protein
VFELKLNVSKITVITGQGPDKILIHSDLPDGCWPYTGKETFECQVAANAGAHYVKTHFKRDPDEIIDTGKAR